MRLTRRPEFLFVQKGARAGGETVLVQARRRAPNGPARVGFTATKKIGGAVVRNRARRRLREAARLLLPLHGLAGVDYVFLARDATAEAPWRRLVDDVEIALLRLQRSVAPPSGRRSPEREPAAAPPQSEDA